MSEWDNDWSRGAVRMSEVRLLGDFAAAMAERLEANSHKSGWQNDTPLALLRRLKQETGELERAIRQGASAERVIREAADVGNFAAMIADVVRRPAEES